ncbi:MAG: heme o synthase [Nibricoccus sp.]
MNPVALPLPSPSLAETTPRATFRDYLELTKPRLSLLSVITAVVGYFAAHRSCDLVVFIPMLIGTSFAAAGVASLNQWMERDTDALMKRTADRPIPSGRVNTGAAFVLGWALCVAGLGLLFAKVNGLSAFFALATMVSYLALYTPAKRWSRWSTEIGAVAGAFPPLIGSAAATGPIEPLGWILFGVLLFWQIPHFMAIAWTYRRDYEAVNFPMLPVRDASGRLVARWSLLHTTLAVGAAISPFLFGLASRWYLGVSIILGVWFVYKAGAFLRASSREKTARSLFFASIIWLPLQLAALVADRWLLS